MPPEKVTPEQAARIREATKAVNDAENALAGARENFRATLEAVHGEGAKLTAIGRELGISRQRVAQIIGG